MSEIQGRSLCPLFFYMLTFSRCLQRGHMLSKVPFLSGSSPAVCGSQRCRWHQHPYLHCFMQVQGAVVSPSKEAGPWHFALSGCPLDVIQPRRLRTSSVGKELLWGKALETGWVLQPKLRGDFFFFWPGLGFKRDFYLIDAFIQSCKM